MFLWLRTIMFAAEMDIFMIHGILETSRCMDIGKRSDDIWEN